MRILIVEDEILAQEELVRLLKQKYPSFEIAGATKSVETTVEFLQRDNVDLILMDIELSDGNSFEIFDQIEISTPIIFTTAYEQHALKAFQTSGVAYLLKPIKEDELVKAIEKITSITGISSESYQKKTNNALSILSRNGYKKRIITKKGDQISSVNIEDIAYFIAEDRECYLVTKESKKFFIDYTLDVLEELLDPSSFFRITRNCITSIGSIKQVSKFFNSRLKVRLTPEFDGSDLLISRVRVVKFIKWLDGEL